MQPSFINYRAYRYAVVGGVMAFVSILAYLVDHPRVPPNGGTPLGYVLGTIAGLLVLFLSAFGIRKRAYRRGPGTALGWLSAHVYLGIAALLVATLHSGLHLGWNVHALTYVLMCLVTVSGVWGMYAYLRYPTMMSAQRGSQQRRETLAELSELDERAQQVASATAQTDSLISETVRRTDLGGTGLWTALRARDESTLLLPGETPSQPARLLPNPGHRRLTEILAQMRLACKDPDQRARLQTLLELAGRKSVLLARLRRETQLAALLRVWLYIHIPLCCALLAALVIHVLSVFLYW